MSPHDPLAAAEHDEVALPTPVDRRDLRAWLLTAAPPVAFFATLAIRYGLTSSACGSAVARTIFELVALIGVAACAASGLHVARSLGFDQLRASSDLPGREGSHRLLAQLTVLMSGFFTLLTVAIWIPSLVLSPCDH
jgi:small-conductance mechanosensitive channel